MLLSFALGSMVHFAYADTGKKENTKKSVKLSSINYEYKAKQAPVKFNGKVRKIAYLTNDDGPSPYSAKLIQVLNQNKVPATHFLIGSNVKAYPKYVKQFYNRGDYVGMHTMSHNYNKLYKQGQIVKELKQEQQLIKGITGKSPRLFRSPYGSKPGLTKPLRDQVVKAGLRTWDWTIDSNDWRYQKNPARIVAEVKKQLKRPVEVILIHDKKGTIEALPQIIKTIKDAGYEFGVYEESKHFMVNFNKDNRI